MPDRKFNTASETCCAMVRTSMFYRFGPIALLLIAFSSAAPASKLPTAFDGYVTSVASQNKFEMSAHRVTTDSNTDRQIVETSSGIDAAPTIRVGSLLHVEGRFDKRSGEFVAKSVHFLPEPGFDKEQSKKLEDVGLIEEQPNLHQTGGGAAGTLWVAGYRLKVTPQTKLSSEEGKSFPVDQIRANTWVAFKAKRAPDGSLQAASLKFWSNTITPDEVKYRDKSEPDIQEPDYATHTPGKIKFHLQWMLTILPDKAVQDYVTRVGESLIPQYQKDLPASDPAKINFRFYVVERPSRWKEVLSDASASAGGVVIIPDNVLAVLDNEAQLAALLSNCIATTLDKQLYMHRGREKTQTALGWASDFAGLCSLPVGIGNGIAAKRLLLQINERASRTGLRYMLHAGYDLREAPFSWTVAANEKIQNPEPVGVLPSALVQSVMADLYFDYASTDYSQLKANRETYHKMLAELRSAAPRLPKPKNYPAD